MTGFWRSRRIKIQICEHFKAPQQAALAVDILAPSLWNGAALAPGSRGDVQQIWLDNSRDPEEDKIRAGLRPALGPGFSRHAVDNRIDPPPGANNLSPASPELGWESFPGPDEQVRAANTIALYQAELADLTAQTNPTLADTRRAAELEELIVGLQTFGHLKVVPGGGEFGDDVACIYRALAAPNFTFRYRSRFVLEQGSPFTLWLRRFKPVEGQVNHYLQLNIGRRLRLLFEKDRCTLYRRNLLRNPATWTARDAERKALIVKRYGTPAQHDQITAWRDAIEGIKQDYKGHSATPQQKADIETLKRQISALQATFALTDAEKARLEELEKFLFTQKETVELDETSDTLVGVPFSLTFFDFGIGIAEIACDIGRNSWIYQDCEILKAQAWAPLWGTVADRRAPGYDGEERLEIEGNGGALLWKFGYVKVNTSDALRGFPMFLGRDDLDTAAGVIVNGQWTPGLAAPNNVAFLLDNLGGAVAPRAGWYQLGVGFITDGRHYPIVTRASIQLPAVAREPSAIVWDSEDPQINHGGIELTAKFDSGRGVIYEVKIHNRDGTDMGLPERLYEMVCNIFADDGAGNWTPLVTGGIIAEESREDLAGLTLYNEPTEDQTFSEVCFPVVSKLRAARQARFPSTDFVFDGEFDNNIVIAALKSVGYADDELAIAPDTGNRAHSAAPGEKPVLKPDRDARVLDYLEKEVTGVVGAGKEIFVDAAGLIRYEDPALRLFAAPYLHASTATDPRRQYFATDAGVIARTWNTDDYFTQLRVEGGINPETKQPFVAEYEITEAIDEAFGPAGSNDPRFIGHHKPMETEKNENLNSQAACERRLAVLIIKHGTPRPEWRVIIPYEEGIMPGDRMMFEGGEFKLLGIPGPDVTGDEMALALSEVMGGA